MRSASRLSNALVAGTALLVLSAAPALAQDTPVENGCPASTQLYSVAWLETQGPYRLPAALDDPANGGNGDGYVCALPMPEAVSTAKGAPVQLYQFFENNLPAIG